MEELLRHISIRSGITIRGIQPVHGGDINKAYCLDANNGKQYFLKVNSAGQFPEMFELEREGLKELRQKGRLSIPEVLGSGTLAGQQWLLLIWLQKTTAKEGSFRLFGQQLADLHRHQQPYFGWHADNYIGSLKQVNTRADSWSVFFTEYRLNPLIRQLVDNGSFSKPEMAFAASFAQKL